MSSNGIAVRQEAGLVLDDAKVALLRDTIANGAPALQFDLFVAVCNRTGLDPFAKQIWFIERGGKWNWQTSIDGYRLIADRTGNYAGSDDPVFTEPPGQAPYDKGAHPFSATVTVWKIVQGQRCPFTATVRWAEYNQPNSPTWNRMPYLMLSKCAESLALRKAFPAELSGLYTREEMMQADAPNVVYEGEVVDAETGEIAGDSDGPSTPEYDAWVPLIQAAETMEDLEEIGRGMKAANVESADHPGIEKEYRKRLNRLKIDAAKANRAAQDAAARAA